MTALKETRAIFEIRQGRFYEAIWFLCGPEHKRDWMAAMWTDGDEDDWHVVYRFRYYLDDVTDPLLKSADKKSVSEVKIPKSEPKAKIRAVVDTMAKGLMEMGFGTELDVLDLRTADARTIGRKLTARPWAHAREITGRGDA